MIFCFYIADCSVKLNELFRNCKYYRTRLIRGKKWKGMNRKPDKLPLNSNRLKKNCNSLKYAEILKYEVLAQELPILSRLLSVDADSDGKLPMKMKIVRLKCRTA